jgi:hypothetical protein
LRDLKAIEGPNSKVEFHDLPLKKEAEYKYQTDDYTVILKSLKGDYMYVCIDGQIDIIDAKTLKKQSTVYNDSITSVIAGIALP